MKILKKKDGFTLVEMLIVLFIIAVLSTMAINGYTQFRRTSLLDFAVDNFILKFYEFKERTTRGDFGGDSFDKIKIAIEDPDEVYDPVNDPDAMSDAKCYGFYFVADGDVIEVKEVEIPYSNKKVFEGAVYKEKGCEYPINFGLIEYPSLEMDEEVSVLGLYGIDDDENEVEIDNFVLSFIPPDGKFEFYNPLTEQVESEYVEIKMEIKYGESDQDEYKRSIFMNLDSVQAYLKQPEDENAE